MACPQDRNEEFVITIPPEVPRINIPLDLPPAEWPECCIYRVPKQLRKVNEEAYTPKLVSIGPFHHSRKELRDMEMHKLRYLNDFLERTGKRQEDLLKIIRDIEEKIRRCYSEDPLKIIKSNDFVQMILLDAIFIIELFLKVKEAAEKEEAEKKGAEKKEAEKKGAEKKEAEKKEEAAEKKEAAEKEEAEKKESQRQGKEYDKKETDYILRKPWLKTGILHDLILLENQLPFFVLEKLYMFALNESSSSKNFTEGTETEKHTHQDPKKKNALFVNLSRRYFECYYRLPMFDIIGEEVKHFTDLVRYLFCPPNMEQIWKEKMGLWSSTRKEEVPHSLKKKIEESSGTRFCATKLDDAGLKFKEVKKDRHLLDIRLPGVLQQVSCHGLVERFTCLTNSCLCACFPCLMCLMCFPCFMKCLLQLTLPGCFGRPMHILKIPHVVIDGYTEAIFRNLMALEQCHYPSKTYICSYALLLDSLIDTEKDVDLLVDKKVIVNNLGSNAIVMDLINKLGDHIEVTPSSYFDYIGQNLNKHYEFPLNHFLATLTREYFPNVFRGTATVVGLIILGFTFWNFIRPFVM